MGLSLECSWKTIQAIANHLSQTQNSKAGQNFHRIQNHLHLYSCFSLERWDFTCPRKKWAIQKLGQKAGLLTPLYSVFTMWSIPPSNHAASPKPENPPQNTCRHLPRYALLYFMALKELFFHFFQFHFNKYVLVSVCSRHYAYLSVKIRQEIKIGIVIL